MPTKIPWTNELIVPMQIYMTFFAYSPNIVNMRIRVAKMVMIFYGFFAAIKTRQYRWFCKSAFFNGIIQKARYLLLTLFRWCKIFSFNTFSFRTAAITSRTKFIISAFVFAKICFRKPYFAFITTFQPALCFFKIFFWGDLKFFASNNHCSTLCLCHKIFPKKQFMSIL